MGSTTAYDGATFSHSPCDGWAPECGRREAQRAERAHRWTYRDVGVPVWKIGAGLECEASPSPTRNVSGTKKRSGMPIEENVGVCRMSVRREVSARSAEGVHSTYDIHILLTHIIREQVLFVELGELSTSGLCGSDEIQKIASIYDDV